MATGKSVRLDRIASNGMMVCVPIDHGLSSGPIQGLESIEKTILSIERGGATSILAQKGVFKSMKQSIKMGRIVHLSGSTEMSNFPDRKVQVGSVESAIRMGADAISIHVNVGSKDEHEMIEQLGRVADSCDEWGMPLIAMMYPRGESTGDSYDAKIVSHVARIGAELGADIVKTVYTGNTKSFAKVIESCPVPIVVAGGPKIKSDRDALQIVYDAISAGAKGVTFGRTVFQHASPERMTRALSSIVLTGATVDEALKVSDDGREKG